MGSHTVSSGTSRINRSVRTSLVVLVACGLAVLALILLERSGPAPVRPLFRAVSSNQTATLSGGGPSLSNVSTAVVPNQDNKPKKHCDDDGKNRGQGGDKHCRPPSGDHGDRNAWWFWLHLLFWFWH